MSLGVVGTLDGKSSSPMDIRLRRISRQLADKFELRLETFELEKLAQGFNQSTHLVSWECLAEVMDGRRIPQDRKQTILAALSEHDITKIAVQPPKPKVGIESGMIKKYAPKQPDSTQLGVATMSTQRRVKSLREAWPRVLLIVLLITAALSSVVFVSLRQYRAEQARRANQIASQQLSERERTMREATAFNLKTYDLEAKNKELKDNIEALKTLNSSTTRYAAAQAENKKLEEELAQLKAGVFAGVTSVTDSDDQTTPAATAPLAVVEEPTVESDPEIPVLEKPKPNIRVEPTPRRNKSTATFTSLTPQLRKFYEDHPELKANDTR